MTDKILKVSDDFWNIRGVFKIAGLLDIGTHASLVRQRSGRFVMLDAYSLRGKVKAQVDALTNGGKDLDAIVNLHPFHTVHVEKLHRQYPEAKLFGTERHLEKFPELPWQSDLTESEKAAKLFADDFDFSVPEGVDFISSNEHLHFSSVLAFHRASRTIHSDDTLMYLRLPGLLSMLKTPEVTFHMTLAQTLERRPSAAKDFRRWARGLAKRWRDAESLCAAHSAALLASENRSESIADRILQALQKVEKTLRQHERKFD